MGGTPETILFAMRTLTTLFVFVVGAGILVVIFIYIVDGTQTSHTVRRNFPVVGRFRYLFEHVGEFFRQYFFALDREEMPDVGLPDRNDIRRHRKILSFARKASWQKRLIIATAR